MIQLPFLNMLFYLSTGRALYRVVLAAKYSAHFLAKYHWFHGIQITFSSLDCEMYSHMHVCVFACVLVTIIVRVRVLVLVLVFVLVLVRLCFAFACACAPLVV